MYVHMQWDTHTRLFQNLETIARQHGAEEIMHETARPGQPTLSEQPSVKDPCLQRSQDESVNHKDITHQKVVQ